MSQFKRESTKRTIMEADQNGVMSEHSDQRPNILLVVLDSVRATNTSLHDHSRETTPFLEEFATKSTFYEQARAPSTWSLPSHVSMFTGVPPHVHGVTSGDQCLRQGHSIWEELASEFGYSTGVFTSNIYLTDAPVGLNELFQTSEGRDEIARFPEALTPTKTEGELTYKEYVSECLSHRYPIKSIINGAERKMGDLIPDNIYSREESDHCSIHSRNFEKWIKNQPGPWAACLNFMDAHRPYVPDDEYNIWGNSDLKSTQSSINKLWDFPSGKEPWEKCAALEALYDGTIRQMDAEIEALINSLQELREYRNTHIIITGDHGEGFGEYCNTREGIRYVAHGYGLAEELLHVPLLSKKPGQKSGEYRNRLASLTSFYEVVKSSVKGEEGREVTFEKDSFLVSSHERTSQINKYLAEDSNYHGDSFALYRENGDTIEKLTKWGDDKSVITFKKERTEPVVSVESSDHKVIEQTLSASEKNTLNEAGVGTDALDDNTKNRLEDLGYM